MKEITILKKSCGHYGIVRGNYKLDEINCTQCEMKTSSSVVAITCKKTMQKTEFPELDKFDQIQNAIKKILGETKK